MKKVICWMTLGIIAISISGCGEELSDHVIESDVQQAFDNTYGVTFDQINVAIDQNQMYDDGNRCSIIASVEAQTESADVQASVSAEYDKTSGEWDIIDYDVYDVMVSVTDTTVTEEDDLGRVQGEYGDLYQSYELDNRDISSESQEAIFTYTANRDSGYRKIYDTIESVYQYSLYDGWTSLETGVIDSRDEWDINGRWTYENLNDTMWIDVSSFDGETIEMEYDLSYEAPTDINGNAGITDMHLKSEGTVSMDVRKDDEEESWHVNLDDSSVPPVLYITSEGGITFNGYVWNPHDTFIFYYEDGDGYDTREQNGLWSNELKLYDEDTILPVSIEGGGRTYSHISMGDSFKLGFERGLYMSDGDGNAYLSNMYYIQSESSYAQTCSEIFDLYSQYTTLKGTAYLGELASTSDSAKITIYGDDQPLYTCVPSDFSGKANDEFEIDVSGVRNLKIECSGESDSQSVFLGGSLNYPVLALADLTVSR